MPVPDDCPEPLKTAINDMEAQVQAFKKDTAYKAPEQMRDHWIDLQQGLVATMATLYEGMGGK
jgi:hypothetical protein